MTNVRVPAKKHLSIEFQEERHKWSGPKTSTYDVIRVAPDPTEV